MGNQDYLFVYMYSLRILFFRFPNEAVISRPLEFLKINWFLLIIYSSTWENGRYSRETINTEFELKITTHV